MNQWRRHKELRAFRKLSHLLVGKINKIHPIQVDVNLFLPLKSPQQSKNLTTALPHPPSLRMGGQSARTRDLYVALPPVQQGPHVYLVMMLSLCNIL